MPITGRGAMPARLAAGGDGSKVTQASLLRYRGVPPRQHRTGGDRFMAQPASQFDFDWLVIGSGFGGSVSALRLAEKGYRVGVLESGRRFADRDFPKTNWN